MLNTHTNPAIDGSTNTEGVAANAPNQPLWLTAFCGLAMGAADIVPGVSGGTVALILGIYHRLLGALSHIDRDLLGLLKQQKWASAAKHVDLKFLLALGTGILTGVVTLASLLEYLLTHHRPETYALFFGLILASGLLVGRMVHPRKAKETLLCWGLGIGGGLFALWLASLGHRESMPGLPYTFLCGVIGISAMILPGISGAHLLLLLGKYEEMTSIIKGLPRGEASAEELLTVAIFCSGCLVGLLLFSRFVRWLLDRYAAPTLATLCGFMIGSLLRVWPFQTDISPEVEEFKHKIFEPYFPQAWSSEILTCLLIALGGFLFVFLADHFANKLSASRSEITNE